MSARRFLTACFVPIAAAFTVVGAAPGQQAPTKPAPAKEPPVNAQKELLSKEAFLTPPKEIADALKAMQTENVTLSNLSPDGKKFVVVKSDGPVPVERLGRHHVILGELAFEPDARRSHDFYVRSDAGYEIFYPKDKRTVKVQLPAQSRAARPTWSPDGKQLAFFAHFEDATHIYVADAETGASKKVTPYPVVASMVTSFQWSKDGKRIQTVLVPDDGKKELPKAGAVATEPKVRVTRGGPNPSRTYRFLLDTPQDMALLEYVLTGQLALVDVADGKVEKVGPPAMYRTVAMSPSEDVYRVTQVKKPFSYFVPVANFGSTESFVNKEGKSLYTVLDRNLRSGNPDAAAATTPAAGGQGGRGAGGRGGAGGGRGGRGAGGGANPMTTQPPTDPTQQPPVTDPTNPNQPPTDPTQPPVDPDAPPRPFTPAADPDGKRELDWRPDGVGLSYMQLEPAKPGDDKAPRNDRLMQWMPPFGANDTKVIYSTPNRITGLVYSPDAKYAFVTQVIDNQRTILAIDLADTKKTYVIAKGQGGGAGPVVPPTHGGPAPAPRAVTPDKKGEQGRGLRGGQQPGAQGRGGFTGGGGPTLVTRTGPGGIAVARMTANGEVFLTGTGRGGAGGVGRGAGGEQGRGGAQPGGGFGGGRPTIDKVHVLTGKTTRVFESKADVNETLEGFDDEVSTVYTTRRSGAVSDAYMTDVPSGKSTKLTNNVDPAPWARKLKVERFTATRVDGVRINIRVTLPPDAKGKLPALFWIYPREYADAQTYMNGAGRGGANPAATQVGPRSMSMVTLLGYALVEPDVPIIGPAGRMNDNYIPDLRNSLWAAIDELDKRGVIDRDRLACGGHSYGAFSTANAMAHTPFFKAGIAGDGNYNRLLTPMSFQTERRNLWDARETYLNMSPLLYANQIQGALLMYHGMDDQNVGTNPMNAEHLFAALDGLGKPAALYMYPYEGHGPIAKETLGDMWARWAIWLDMYVKNPKPVTPPAARPVANPMGAGNGD